VEDSVGYGGAGAGNADFADPTATEWIEFAVWNVEGRDLDLPNVSVDWDVILVEVIVDDAA
jgi:hypothetical protein